MKKSITAVIAILAIFVVAIIALFIFSYLQSSPDYSCAILLSPKSKNTFEVALRLTTPSGATINLQPRAIHFISSAQVLPFSPPTPPLQSTDSTNSKIPPSPKISYIPLYHHIPAYPGTPAHITIQFPKQVSLDTITINLIAKDDATLQELFSSFHISFRNNRVFPIKTLYYFDNHPAYVLHCIQPIQSRPKQHLFDYSFPDHPHQTLFNMSFPYPQGNPQNQNDLRMIPKPNIIRIDNVFDLRGVIHTKIPNDSLIIQQMLQLVQSIAKMKKKLNKDNEQQEIHIDVVLEQYDKDQGQVEIQLDNDNREIVCKSFGYQQGLFVLKMLAQLICCNEVVYASRLVFDCKKWKSISQTFQIDVTTNYIASKEIHQLICILFMLHFDEISIINPQGKSLRPKTQSRLISNGFNCYSKPQINNYTSISQYAQPYIHYTEKEIKDLQNFCELLQMKFNVIQTQQPICPITFIKRIDDNFIVNCDFALTPNRLEQGYGGDCGLKRMLGVGQGEKDIKQLQLRYNQSIQTYDSSLYYQTVLRAVGIAAIHQCLTGGEIATEEEIMQMFFDDSKYHSLKRLLLIFGDNLHRTFSQHNKQPVQALGIISSMFPNVMKSINMNSFWIF